ncbi:hypothetical protein [Thermus sediminis]|uniref:hypothetical protein n=1 Tax=Thermus sediminis TaxID=1761908 RepID=UPI000E3DCB1F|nr:hypothetical protein [Thermus sediminis]
MKRKLVGLTVLLAGLSLAQTTQTTDDHTVTVIIPSVLQLSLDARNYKFDFSDTGLTGSETVTVNGTSHTKASQAAYDAFLDAGTGTQIFAPTLVEGTGGADYGTLTIRSNRAQWTVKIDSITGNLTLGNSRVLVFAEKVSGKGGSWTGVPTALSSGITLINANSGGQGRSVYRLYYLFTMDISDDIPLSDINERITINLLLTSP